MTRLQTMQTEGLEPNIPDAGIAAYLVKYLFEVGPVFASDTGRGPITWSEINAWMHTTGRMLQTWECTLLRRLSSDYLGAAMDATDPACPAPYSDQPSQNQRQLVSQKIRSALKGWGSATKGH